MPAPPSIVSLPATDVGDAGDRRRSWDPAAPVAAGRPQPVAGPPVESVVHAGIAPAGVGRASGMIVTVATVIPAMRALRSARYDRHVLVDPLRTPSSHSPRGDGTYENPITDR
jgi:hypothetical protein